MCLYKDTRKRLSMCVLVCLFVRSLVSVCYRPDTGTPGVCLEVAVVKPGLTTSQRSPETIV